MSKFAHKEKMMDKLLRRKTTFRIQERYLDMLEEIVNYQNNLPEFIESGDVRNDRAVIEDAIEYYHTFVMGGDMLDSLIPKTVDLIAENINKELYRFLDTLEPALQNQIEIQNLNKEMLGVGLRQMGCDLSRFTHDNGELLRTSKENEIIFFEFEQAVKKKKNIN